MVPYQESNMFIRLTQTYKQFRQVIMVQSLNIAKIYDGTSESPGANVHMIGDSAGMRVDQTAEEIVALTLKGKSL